MLLRSNLLSSVSLFNLPRAAGDEGAPAADPLAVPADPEADESHDPGAAAPAEPPAPAAAAAEDGEAEPPAPAAQDWRDREIRRKHAQIQEAKRREEELRRENEELRAIATRAAPKEGETALPAAAAKPAPTVDRDAVREEAARLNAQERYTTDCNAADAVGRKTYDGKNGKPSWNQATEQLVALGGVDIETMVSILATDDPARVMYEMGSNPDEYHRVMDLPPARRNNELVKLGLKAAAAPAKPKKVSDAPAPVEPVQGRGVRGNDDLDDDLDDDTWFARRRAQKLDKWKADRAAGRV